MRVNVVVVGDPSWQLTHDGFGIWSRTDADIVALDRANEGFSHSVALWTFERRRPRFEADVAGEAAGVAGDVAEAGHRAILIAISVAPPSPTKFKTIGITTMTPIATSTKTIANTVNISDMMFSQMKTRLSGSLWTKLSASKSDFIPALALHNDTRNPAIKVSPSVVLPCEATRVIWSRMTSRAPAGTKAAILSR